MVVWEAGSTQRLPRPDLVAASTTSLLLVLEALATEAVSAEALVADIGAMVVSEAEASEAELHEVTLAVVADLEVIGAASVLAEVVLDTSPMAASATLQTPHQLGLVRLEVGTAVDLAVTEAEAAGMRPMAEATVVAIENEASLEATWSLLARETEIEVATATEIVMVGTTIASETTHANENMTVMDMIREANEGIELATDAQDEKRYIYQGLRVRLPDHSVYLSLEAAPLSHQRQRVSWISTWLAAPTPFINSLSEYVRHQRSPAAWSPSMSWP